jgi:hypothetical protein
MALLRAPKAPNLINAPQSYEARYHDQYSREMRLYFNTIDNSLSTLYDRAGGDNLMYSYGAFYDTTTQTLVAANTAKAMTFNSTDSAYHVNIGTPTSRVYVRNEGIYNIQFSAQLDKSGASSDHIYIWLRLNGTNVANSATKVSLSGSDSETVAAWNFIATLQADEYFELMWASSTSTAVLLYEAATAFCPAIPSVLLSVTRVSDLYP